MHRYIKNKIKLLENTGVELESNINKQIRLGMLSALKILNTGREPKDLINLYESFTTDDIRDSDHLIRVNAALEELHFIIDTFTKGDEE